MANNSKQMVMVPPKKPFNPKILYTFDLIFLVAFTVALVFLIPFDINADFIGKTEVAPESITEFLESRHLAVTNLCHYAHRFPMGLLYHRLCPLSRGKLGGFRPLAYSATVGRA